MLHLRLLWTSPARASPRPCLCAILALPFLRPARARPLRARAIAPRPRAYRRAPRAHAPIGAHRVPTRLSTHTASVPAAAHRLSKPRARPARHTSRGRDWARHDAPSSFFSAPHFFFPMHFFSLIFFFSLFFFLAFCGAPLEAASWLGRALTSRSPSEPARRRRGLPSACPPRPAAFFLRSSFRRLVHAAASPRAAPPIVGLRAAGVVASPSSRPGAAAPLGRASCLQASRHTARTVHDVSGWPTHSLAGPTQRPYVDSTQIDAPAATVATATLPSSLGECPPLSTPPPRPCRGQRRTRLPMVAAWRWA